MLPMNRSAIALLCISGLVSLVGTPAVQAQERGQPLGEVLRSAAPRAQWSPEGNLVYSDGAPGDDSYRILDPRTGADREFAGQPNSTPEDTRVVRPGLFAHMPPVREVATADRSLFASTRDGNVWVRPGGSEEGTRLTTDGQVGYGYDIEGAKWSPDQRFLAVKKVDARDVPTISLGTPGDPESPVIQHPYSRAGEPIPRAELYIVSQERGDAMRVDLGDGEEPYLHIFGWSAKGDELHVMRMSRLMDRLDLLGVDPLTGETRTILSESSSTFIVGLPFMHGYTAALERLNHVVMLEDGKHFIWTSERDGWRRLYLYGIDGTLIRALTPHGSEVAVLEGMDEERGWVYYTARIDPERPYDVTLLRVPLEGGSPEPLVEGPTFHVLEFDSAREFFWTVRSGIDRPPVLEVRRTNGALVRELWSGETIVRESGWVPPDQFRTLAADGETELFGVLFKPRDFDPTRKYPVLDYIYAGPQTTHVPRSMVSRSYSVSQGLADLGMIVLVVDARGTPERGKAFQDAFFGQIGQHEIADHAAVIRQLASERAYMDIERVGALGHSWGGYGVLRALLLEPDLYRVGVASAAGVDLEHFRVSIEPYMGCLPRDCPEAYQRGSSTALVHRLDGKLLLLHGTSDDDVPYADAERLMDALTQAGKEYEIEVFPGGNHVIQGPHWFQRVSGYLREHLQP